LLDEVNYITVRKGGQGAVREVIEAYFEAVGFDPKTLVA
jgi:3-deoxy-D-manno-octulosonate 8-phosphate phosphatase KdsC-like HAD superfamily phosphatase